MLPVYGDGQNVRDWLYVEDDCRGILAALEKGRVRETYNLSARCGRSNIEVVEALCEGLEEEIPASENPALQAKGVAEYRDLIGFVDDRPGHDSRYAVDPAKAQAELGRRAVETFESGLRKTIEWYLGHEEWCERVGGGEHEDWVQINYGDRSVEV